MNLFELLEAVKHASPEEKKELMDRYYNKDKIVINAMIDSERRKHDSKG